MPELKPCRSKGCDRMVLFARHERTGKVAPLVRDDAGTLRVWPHEGTYAYGTARPTDPDGPRYSSHFADCPGSAAWRRRLKAGGGTRA